MAEPQPYQPAPARREDRPGRISKPGWKDIIMRVAARIGPEHISIMASGMAFYAFLAVPSALTALVALYGLAFDPSAVQAQVASMKGVIPDEALKLITDQLTAVTSSSSSKLSVSFAIALAVAIWGAQSAMSTMITALNVAYNQEEKRGIIRFYATSIAFTLAAIVLMVISIALVAVLPAIIGLLPLGDTGRLLAAALRWPVLLFLIVTGLAMIYRYAPCRAEPRWRWVSPGAIVATVLWLAGSALFSVYVERFASYNKTYGSLGAVAILLIWFYLGAFSVLLGAELDAEIERQTGRDGTTGPDEPIGRRGAIVADEARG
jgi:membrane protein